MRGIQGLLLTLAMLVPTRVSLAQTPEENPYEEALETDRDSFTPATGTVEVRRTIVEMAHSFMDHRDVKETHSFPELLLRYGVDEDIELRLGWNYEVGGAADPFDPGALERDSHLSYGMKARLFGQDDWLPESSLILTGRTPTSGESNETDFAATYVFGWELEDRSKLDAALHYATASEADDDFNVWAPSIVYKVPLGERLDVHAEYIAVFTQGKERETDKHYIKPGVHYLVTPDLEIGVRVGWGLNDAAAKLFTNAGLGYRF